MRNLNKFGLFLLVFFVLGLASANAANFVYPMPIISKPNCRFDNFSDLTSDCKQSFPVLKTSEYKKLKDDYDLRRIYTVLWSATYTYGWDVGHGSHLGVDIATSKGTPVVSMADGSVIYAGAKTGWGNVVTVKHYVNGKTIYSNYAHLSVVNTKVGAKVKAGDKIGEVGSTGNSTGNHLHFQVDTNSGDKSHPYYYFQNCPGNEWNVVNSGSCSSDMKKNTLDPLLFLETQGAIIKDGVVDEDKTKPQEIPQKDLTTVKEIQEREIRDFLRFYDVKLDFGSPTGNVPLGGQMKIGVRIHKKSNGKPFNGILPGGFMEFVVNRNLVKVYPDKLRVIENGKRDIVLTGLKKGITTLYIKIGTVQIKSKKLNIYDPKVKAKVENVQLSANSSLYLGEEKKAFAIFIDGNKVPLVDLPYSGEYKIVAENAYLCPFNGKTNNPDAELKKVCSLGTYKTSLDLNYNSAFKGVPIFGIRALEEGKKTTIKVYDKLKNKVIAEKNIKAKAPRDITIWYSYKKEVISMLEKGIIDGTGKGYFSENRALDEESAIKWIRNFIIYKMKTLENASEKAKYTEALKEINKASSDKFKTLTRIEMLELINKYVPKGYKKDAILYRDLTKEQSIMANKVFNKDYTWKDDFGEKYFQPDQKIKRGEAAYMLFQAQF